MLRFVSFGALILVGALSVAQADVYRWVDEHGEPHYSDQWVPGSQVIKTSKSHPGSDTMSQGHSQQVNRTPESLADEANSRAVHQDVERSRDAQCKAAKDRYMKAIESRRVYKEGKSGEREYMSDADADAYREVARKDVQDRCGNVPSFNPDAPVAEPKPIPEPRPIPEPKADANS
jgi:Domain of unknown function (DUF4124)